MIFCSVQKAQRRLLLRLFALFCVGLYVTAFQVGFLIFLLGLLRFEKRFYVAELSWLTGIA